MRCLALAINDLTVGDLKLGYDKIRERYCLSCLCLKSCASSIRTGSGGGSECFLDVGSSWSSHLLTPTLEQQVSFAAFDR